MSNSETLQRARQWFDLSDQDLADARILAGAGSYGSACFHAQQAGEKAFKGFLVASGRQPKRTHSISDILQGEIPREEFSRFEPERLDNYYLSTRYPESHEASTVIRHSFGRRDAEDALRTAEGTVGILKDWMKEMGIELAEVSSAADREEVYRPISGIVTARLLSLDADGLHILHAGRQKRLDLETLGEAVQSVEPLVGAYVRMVFRNSKMLSITPAPQRGVEQDLS